MHQHCRAGVIQSCLLVTSVKQLCFCKRAVCANVLWIIQQAKGLSAQPTKYFAVLDVHRSGG